LIIYIIWQWLVLGIVPLEGEHGLVIALERGEPATQYLKHHAGVGIVSYIAEYFAFFAIVTSFLGMALGLFDFLSDGLSIKKKGFGQVTLALLIGIPTLLFAVYYERAFLVALDSTGGYGDSILNGIMPVLMVWVGRYRMQLTSSFRVPGGKGLLSVVFLFFLSVLVLEISIHAGWIGG
jgi:tyrosine-specific transport protein